MNTTQFQQLHQPSTGGILLGFDQALRLLKAGKSVRRSGWAAGQVLRMVGEQIYVHPDDKSMDYWEPSQPDILAGDWGMDIPLHR